MRRGIMVIQIAGAGLLAFFAVKVFGKRFIPWLEKHNAVQTVKEEVDRTIYTEKKESSDGN